ncbi:hypothetical protein Tco_1155827 [Tanacetum coccineum]
MIQPVPEGSTQGYPLVSVEVLRYDTKGVKVRIRKSADWDGASTGMNPTRLKTGSIYNKIVGNTKVLSGIEDCHGPSDAMHNPPSHSRSLNRLLFHFSRRLHTFLSTSHSELVDIEKVAVCSSLRSLKAKLNTLVGNPVKKILLKLNLPDHRIHKDGGEGTMVILRPKEINIIVNSSTI